MHSNDRLRRETLLQHVGEEKVSGSPVAPPIVQTSLFVFETVDELWEAQAATIEDRFAYSRISNPTLHAVEKKIARLEGTEHCKVYASGMAAISSAIMSCVRFGAHIVALDTCYGPTKQFIQEYLPKFGIESTFVDGLTTESFVQAFRPNTACVYLESPASIVFRTLDLRAIANEAKRIGATTIHDNSYASPIFQQPASMGVDIVVHSATKYLGGHSDVVAGALCTDSIRMSKIIADETALFGGALPPFPAWLLLRGLRTLPLRMAHAQIAGNQVANWLRNRSEVERVFHIGNEDREDRRLIDAQMSGSTSLLSFVPNKQDMDSIKRFVERLQIFQIGVSWGGFESLVVPIFYHPVDWPSAQWVIRLYVGLESVEDLLEDLEQAFEELSK